MTTCAVVDSNNLVVNLVLAEPTDVAPENCQLIDLSNLLIQPNIGWSWDGTVFINPDPPYLEDYAYGD